MTGKHEAPPRFAKIRCTGNSDKLMYKNLKECRNTEHYHRIVLDLTFHGAKHIDADKAARWCRKAEPGETLQVDPGIEITIEEQEEEA